MPDVRGTDIEPLMRAGVPGFGHRTVMEHYFDWHHSNADTLDKIDKQDFRKNTAALAVLADVPDRPQTEPAGETVIPAPPNIGRTRSLHLLRLRGRMGIQEGLMATSSPAKNTRGLKLVSGGNAPRAIAGKSGASEGGTAMRFEDGRMWFWPDDSVRSSKTQFTKSDVPRILSSCRTVMFDGE